MDARRRPVAFLLGQQRPEEAGISRDGACSELWLSSGSSIFFSQKPISEYPQAKHYTAVGIVTLV